MSKEDPLAKDLKSFSESREVARRDDAEAAEEERKRNDYLVGHGDAAFVALSRALEQRIHRFDADASAQHRMTYSSSGTAVTVRLGIVEANLRYNPGRF